MNKVNGYHQVDIFKNSMPFVCGEIEGNIYGGSFKESRRDRRLILVNMAREISKPADITIPTSDFSVPDMGDMENGVCLAVKSIAHGNDIYAGCMGGVGRTGLFMGCMAKVMKDFGTPMDDPVTYVRQTFKTHAIETEEQQEFVRSFDTTKAVMFARSMQPVGSTIIEMNKLTQESLDLRKLVMEWKNQTVIQRIKRVFTGY